MTSIIDGKRTIGMASPRSGSKMKSTPAEHYGYGGAASDNGAVISHIDHFDESKHG